MKVVICTSLLVGVFHVLIIDRNKLKDHGNLSWKTIIMLLLTSMKAKLERIYVFIYPTLLTPIIFRSFLQMLTILD